jgi:uncharacterized membrane protein YeaQ/YmgE (transglycosylase-associated protein family)
MDNLFNSDSYLWIGLIGLVAGFVARAIKPGDDGMGILWTIVLGVAGSVLATLAGRQLGIYDGSRAAGFIGAVVGALVLLVIVGQVRKFRR